MKPVLGKEFPGLPGASRAFLRISDPDYEEIECLVQARIKELRREMVEILIREAELR
jgi:hypothetical protein